MLKSYRIFILCLSFQLLLGCGGLKQQEDPYAEAWQEVIRSRQWEQASVSAAMADERDSPEFYALPSVKMTEVRPEASPVFLDRYPKLVSRAYFRLIAEAIEADRRVTMAFQELYAESSKEENKNKRRVQRDFETARRRFVAHRKMLEGLRSWNAFHDYGSDDLDFFLKEQFPDAYKFYQKGASEERIVEFLMNELADLYHEQNQDAPRLRF
ncbi:hypothetical protein [Robiginitalea sp. IMCC43444]|uniref:hypothetical protein n=1 Tax=Robiginitalea sp. IMCC43444 TaxID=3459121 RepID=UPI0040424DE2